MVSLKLFQITSFGADRALALVPCGMAAGGYPIRQIHTLEMPELLVFLGCMQAFSVKRWSKYHASISRVQLHLKSCLRYAVTRSSSAGHVCGRIAKTK